MVLFLVSVLSDFEQHGARQHAGPPLEWEQAEMEAAANATVEAAAAMVSPGRSAGAFTAVVRAVAFYVVLLLGPFVAELKELSRSRTTIVVFSCCTGTGVRYSIQPLKGMYVVGRMETAL